MKTSAKITYHLTKDINSILKVNIDLQLCNTSLTRTFFILLRLPVLCLISDGEAVKLE